ncbi:DUF1634 domain-containing protein [Aerosakkonemataceae cyanobacterium BLCC-F50]|uniref:DUF1634 domain-containing protein n=1 Tax=Floridaenema flaviceps BLCC-F50 TaxID=3153642 RepID=A0ABV4XUT4_9CYAN
MTMLKINVLLADAPLPDPKTLHSPSSTQADPLINHGEQTNALSFRRRGLIQFGLLILIATPILRVAFSAIAFAKQGDRTYLIITLLVLAILLYSLFNPT